MDPYRDVTVSIMTNERAPLSQLPQPVIPTSVKFRLSNHVYIMRDAVTVFESNEDTCMEDLQFGLQLHREADTWN